MKKMNTLIMAIVMVALVSISSVAVIGLGIEGDNYDDELDIAWAEIPPTVDGDIDVGEYTNATVVDIDFYPDPPHRNDTIYIYFMNDADWLYIAVDLLPDNTSDDGDYCYIAFDEDNNDEWEAVSPNNEAFYVIYIEEELVRAEAEGLIAGAESTKPFIWASDFTKTVNDDDVNHRVWEFAIPLSNFIHGELDLGDTVGMCAFGYGTLAPAWDYPINSTEDDYDDATNWAELTLATEPVPAQETGLTADEYAMIMIGIATVILMVVVLFYKETIVKWIAENDFKMMFIVFGISLGLLVFGILQWYYDWLAWLGL